MQRVFISYSQVDSHIADSIELSLSRRRIPCFRDVKDIRWGRSITSTVSEELAKSTQLIVILSSQSLASHWVLYEMGQAAALGKTILPFVTDKSVDLPIYLRDLAYLTELSQVDAHFAATTEVDQNIAAQTTEQECFCRIVPSISLEFILQRIRNAKQHIRILDAWLARPEDICLAIRESSVPGRTASFLYVDPIDSNSILQQRFKDLGQDVADASARCAAALRDLKGLRHYGVEVRTFRALPPFHLCWIDNAMFIGLFWHTRLSSQGPFLADVNLGTPLFRLAAETYDKLWNSGSTPK